MPKSTQNQSIFEGLDQDLIQFAKAILKSPEATFKSLRALLEDGKATLKDLNMTEPLLRAVASSMRSSADHEALEKLTKNAMFNGKECINTALSNVWRDRNSQKKSGLSTFTMDGYHQLTWLMERPLPIITTWIENEALYLQAEETQDCICSQPEAFEGEYGQERIRRGFSEFNGFNSSNSSGCVLGELKEKSLQTALSELSKRPLYASTEWVEELCYQSETLKEKSNHQKANRYIHNMNQLMISVSQRIQKDLLQQPALPIVEKGDLKEFLKIMSLSVSNGPEASMEGLRYFFEEAKSDASKAISLKMFLESATSEAYIKPDKVYIKESFIHPKVFDILGEELEPLTLSASLLGHLWDNEDLKKMGERLGDNLLESKQIAEMIGILEEASDAQKMDRHHQDGTLDSHSQNDASQSLIEKATISWETRHSVAVVPEGSEVIKTKTLSL